MDQQERPIPPEMIEAVHRLVEDNRLQCLWFMKEDYLPASVREAVRALAAIEQHGSLQAWTEARTLLAWLSQSISAGS